MSEHNDNTGRRVANTIDQRVGAGDSALVAGWQKMLAELLGKMSPYLSAGHLVTFRDLLPKEKTFFETLHREIAVPPHATALFISPSVRRRMMGGRPADGGEGATGPAPTQARDDGILLACRSNDYAVIVNALFAHPPHTPAVDVYEDGRLVAGYSYLTRRDCVGDLGAILGRHLSSN